METGDLIKVFPPGEGLWGYVVAMKDDGRVVVRLENEPASPLHGYGRGDVVTFEPVQRGDINSLELAPLDRQLPSLR